jgi:class 3 adenylate cyclase
MHGRQVRLQIGMDSGKVVETILGRRLLPRWKLFGDTVNTASRCAAREQQCGRCALRGAAICCCSSCRVRWCTPRLCCVNV